MKKFSICAILVMFFVFVALPMSVLAMTAIDDNELAEITGQAGVSINVDVTANLSIGTIAWGDSDGFTGYSNAGYVGIEGLNLTTHFSGRHDGPFATTGPSAIGRKSVRPRRHVCRGRDDLQQRRGQRGSGHDLAVHAVLVVG